MTSRRTTEYYRTASACNQLGIFWAVYACSLQFRQIICIRRFQNIQFTDRLGGRT
jgi:hypothetical protein